MLGAGVNDHATDALTILTALHREHFTKFPSSTSASFLIELSGFLQQSMSSVVQLKSRGDKFRELHANGDKPVVSVLNRVCKDFLFNEQTVAEVFEILSQSRVNQVNSLGSATVCNSVGVVILPPYRECQKCTRSLTLRNGGNKLVLTLEGPTTATYFTGECENTKCVSSVYYVDRYKTRHRKEY